VGATGGSERKRRAAACFFILVGPLPAAARRPPRPPPRRLRSPGGGGVRSERPTRAPKWRAGREAGGTKGEGREREAGGGEKARSTTTQYGGRSGRAHRRETAPDGPVHRSLPAQVSSLSARGARKGTSAAADAVMSCSPLCAPRLSRREGKKNEGSLSPCAGWSALSSRSRSGPV
jgi:hypothetical protein